MDDAKSRRDTMSGEYEKIKMRYESGEDVLYNGLNGADAVNEARVDSLKASSDYDKAKADFDKMKILHKSDAEKYTAYSAADDRRKVKKNVYPENDNSSSNAQSAQSGGSSSGAFDRTRPQ